MNRKNRIMPMKGFITLAVLLFSAVSCTTTAPTNHAGLCADWAEFNIGSASEYMIVQNNVWNKGSRNDFEQCIYQADPASSFPFGWTWSWPNADGNVHAYPEIIYGYKPWNPQTTTPNLPVLLSAGKSIIVTYAVTQKVQGAYNRSFDIWLTATNPPTPATITREIMIWLDHSGISPAGTFKQNCTIDGESYAYYNGSVGTGSWTYIAFVKTSPELAGDTKVDKFFDFLVSRNAVSASEYCAAIEFGNEVVYGTGKTEFANYSVSVK
jgi:hypothetical protein